MEPEIRRLTEENAALKKRLGGAAPIIKIVTRMALLMGGMATATGVMADAGIIGGWSGLGLVVSWSIGAGTCAWLLSENGKRWSKRPDGEEPSKKTS